MLSALLGCYYLSSTLYPENYVYPTTTGGGDKSDNENNGNNRDNYNWETVPYALFALLGRYTDVCM